MPAELITKSKVGTEIDVIFGVNGLEYTDMSETIRCLKDTTAENAEFLFVMHHPESPIVMNIRLEMSLLKAKVAVLELSIAYLMNEIDEREFIDKFNEVLRNNAMPLEVDELDKLQSYILHTVKVKRKLVGEQQKLGKVIEAVKQKFLEQRKMADLYYAQYEPLMPDSKKLFGSKEEVNAFFENQGLHIKLPTVITMGSAFYVVHLEKSRTSPLTLEDMTPTPLLNELPQELYEHAASMTNI